MVFPYVAGTAWIQRRSEAGGWAAVDAAYDEASPRRPRRSSTPTGPRRARGSSTRATGRRRRAFPPERVASTTDTLGEWTLRTLLERAGAANAAALAAEWQDDRIVFFEPKESWAKDRPRSGSSGGSALTSPAAAKRLADALERFYERPDGAESRQRDRRGDRVEVARGRMRRPPPRSGRFSSPQSSFSAAGRKMKS